MIATFCSGGLKTLYISVQKKKNNIEYNEHSLTEAVEEHLTYLLKTLNKHV